MRSRDDFSRRDRGLAGILRGRLPLLQRWCSVLIAAHITALCVVAVPWGSSKAAGAGPTTGELRWLERALADVAVRLERASRRAYTATEFLRPSAHHYVRVTGLFQNWAMFASPPRFDYYGQLRLTFEPAGGSGPRTVLRRLVFPRQPEGQLRLFGAFENSYWDKAFERTIHTHLSDLYAPTGSLALEERHAHFRPFLRILENHFRETFRAEGGLVRSELWIGTAPVLGPDQSLDFDWYRLRLRTLFPYYKGVLGEAVSGPAALFGTVEREGEIVWRLSGIHELPTPASR